MFHLKDRYRWFATGWTLWSLLVAFAYIGIFTRTQDWRFAALVLASCAVGFLFGENRRVRNTAFRRTLLVLLILALAYLSLLAFAGLV